jgi:SSS family solute:Na+ symporter
VPGGWAEIIGTGDRSHLILPASHKEIPSTGLVVLALSTNIWFFCTNQTINQSALGAKNLWHAKMGVLLAGFLSIVIAFADVFPGMIAYALNPNLPVADEAYPYIVGRVIPAGAPGAGIRGAAGGYPCQRGSPGQRFGHDLYFDIYRNVINPGATERQLIRIGRAAAVVVLVVGAIWAPIVMRFGHIFSYFQECWAFIAIPVAVLFTLGVLWKGVTARSALWTLCLSFPMLVLPYLLRTYEVTWNVYNVAGIVLIFTLLFTVLTSLRHAGRQRRQNHRGHLESLHGCGGQGAALVPERIVLGGGHGRAVRGAVRDFLVGGVEYWGLMESVILSFHQ